MSPVDPSSSFRCRQVDNPALTASSYTARVIRVRLFAPSETGSRSRRPFAPFSEGCLEVGLGRQLITLQGLYTILESVARRGRQGAGVLRVLLDKRSEGDDLAESVLEARMLRLCRNEGLPQPVCQHRVHDGPRLVGRIDFAYPADRVAIEVDGYESHASLDAFRHDRARQNELVALGWTVLRFTWDDVVHHPARVVRVVRGVLCAQSNTGC